MGTAAAIVRRAHARASVFGSRIVRSKPLCAVAIVLAGLALFGQLAPATAAVVALLVAAVVAFRPARFDEEGAERPWPGSSGRAARARADAEGWRGVIDAIPDAAVALDGAGTVLHHNARAHELFPRIKAGQPVSHATRNPELIGAVEAVDTSAPIEVELLERVPVERRILATVSRLPGTRALPAILVTFRDLSEQDKLTQMRADFIANASHELRTPLASLRGFVETLQGPARDDPAARDRFLALMSSQANRMTRLIDDLLSLSRVEMRAHLPPRGIVELNEVVGYVVQMLEPVAQAANATVTVERLDRPARVRGDRDEIVQVLHNLVQNAIKYGRDGGHVTVKVGREEAATGDGALLTGAVGDDGPGIAPQHLPRLTERFYRANVASSREKGGTGLGLAIVKHIVNRHRGDLRIASELGKGSTFTVVLDELGSAAPDRVDEKTSNRELYT